jgi:uncharacterized protein (DUF1499 family)
MRRLLIEEPYSEAALWSRKLAVFSAAVGAISVVLARSGTVDYPAVMSVFAAALLVACASLLLASTGAVVIWRTGRRGMGVICSAVVVAALVLGYPTYLLAQAIRLPPISDVSTDLVNPPSFPASARALAARDGVVYGDLSEADREAQSRAYPDIQPIVLDLEMDDAWRLAVKAVTARGWRIVEEIYPGGPTGAGYIEAIARSQVMGLPDDVTVRITPLSGQTKIDVRAASRYGRHDFGSNAARIERFSDELQTQLDAR